MAEKKFSFNVSSIILAVGATLLMIVLQYAERFIADSFIAPLQDKYLTIPATLIMFFVVCPMWAIYFRALFAILRKPYSNGPWIINGAAIICFAILLVFGLFGFVGVLWNWLPFGAQLPYSIEIFQITYSRIYMVAFWFSLFCVVCRSCDAKAVKTEEEETPTAKA